LSSVPPPTLAAAVNRLNLTTHVPRTDSNSVNLSFGKSGGSPVHAERYQTLSLKLISSLETRCIKSRLPLYFQMADAAPSPCRSSFDRRPPYETPSMNKLNKVMQAPHKKHNLIPTGTTLSSSSPKRSRPSIPLQISIQACHRDIMPST
jgi:hypothetical protein